MFCYPIFKYFVISSSAKPVLAVFTVIKLVCLRIPLQVIVFVLCWLIFNSLIGLSIIPRFSTEHIPLIDGSLIGSITVSTHNQIHRASTYLADNPCLMLSAKSESSRKHLRTKITPDFHLIYSKNGGNLWLVSK